MSSISLTPEVKQAISYVFEEWSKKQSEIEQARIVQKDIIASLSSKLGVKKSDLRFALATIHQGKQSDALEQIEERDTLLKIVEENT